MDINNKKKTFDLFNQSEKFSTKHSKYFSVYDQLFSKYQHKNITFVEIGILDGGSLLIWKKFFGPKSRIIGIDQNPLCKKLQNNDYEIFIGSQSDSNFWKSFFNQVGNVDIILDDGGHTNEQQIITTINCIPNINDDGLMVVEDVHCSYQKNFGNPNNYSFVNFAKKKIDDVNFTFPNLGRMKNSLNEYIYSLQFFESIVAFKINRTLCKTNEIINNNGEVSNNLDTRDGDKVFFFRNKFTFFLNFKLVKKFERIILRFINVYKSFMLRKYFD